MKNNKKNNKNRTGKNTPIPEYLKSQSSLFEHTIAFASGFAIGFAILFIFYKLLIVSMIGGLILGLINIFIASGKAIKKRITNLRLQFYDLLEAMSVSLRAGNPLIRALEKAREDLILM